MTQQELRDLYGCLKSRAENADSLPSFAAVLRARKEGRLEAYQYLDKGKLIIRGKNKGEWYWDYFKDWEN